MSKIVELKKLISEDPIDYTSKLNVYFIFDGEKEPEILTTRYVADKQLLKSWFEKAKSDKKIRIVVVWPGQYRSEAFLCDPKIALKDFK